MWQWFKKLVDLICWEEYEEPMTVNGAKYDRAPTHDTESSVAWLCEKDGIVLRENLTTGVWTASDTEPFGFEPYSASTPELAEIDFILQPKTVHHTYDSEGSLSTSIQN
jgi:hypothetical protein